MNERQLWFVAPRHVELRSASLAPLLPGQLRARALASGISQGTELLLFKGEGPQPFDPSLDAPGAPTYPRRYGYAWVGQVCETQSGELELGTHVFALAPHGDVWSGQAQAFRRLPPEIPVERAVLAANLETAINVVWDAGIALGDRVVVIGGGVVGLLCGYAARRGGARNVTLIEPSPARRRVALLLGFDEAVAPEAQDALPDADVVIEASGNPACLDSAIERARLEGIIVVASFYGRRTAPVALGSEFHRRRLTLRASQVSRLPAARSPGWTFERRFELVCRLLHDGALDQLLEPASPFESAPAVYEALARTPSERLQSVFHYAP
jgi:2-desacetyl-2-hydroxyethyl bacteriochlorophyllide A dehydrogenase